MSRFSPGALLMRLRELPDPTCYWVALSGGMDSRVLLHGLHALSPELAIPIKVIHVNHGLNQDARKWAYFCQEVCERLGIACHVLTIDARPAAGQSPEAWARQLRYQAMEGVLEQGDMLLIAHHQDDQAETLLLQLLRGAGPHGLAAMPRWVEFGPGWLGRPLLDFTRDTLKAYAIAQGLTWIEDPSNRDTRFDRNLLRQAILPLLKQRWPSLSRTLGRAAAWQADAAKLMDDIAEQDLEAARSKQRGALSVEALMRLGNVRRDNVLRLWLRDQGLPVPSARQLEQLCRGVLRAAWDAMPCLRWPGAEIHRYRNDLYAMRPLSAHNSRAVLDWDLSTPLRLVAGTLQAELAVGWGLKAALCDHKKITVRFRRGGERCRLLGRPHAHSLKHLFQEAGIPPWQRDRLPLIYLDEELAAVAGLWVCHPFGAAALEAGWRIIWNSSHCCSRVSSSHSPSAITSSFPR